ncbi:hypothetical protein [Sellimonas sp.]|uniref:hypothetical protein n=1 Tax=Sellimonas sp. TaxID=2021466 RepID=UPI000B38AB06|nr:hypothetical protein [Sellimonas sp.]OUP62633.1 hypothetical protein B5F13_12665 [Drancourtella sp. An177]
MKAFAVGIVVLLIFLVACCITEFEIRNDIACLHKLKEFQWEREKKILEQLKQYTTSGYKIFRNGYQLDPDGVGSINYYAYEIVVDEQLLIINLIPKEANRKRIS